VVGRWRLKLFSFPYSKYYSPAGYSGTCLKSLLFSKQRQEDHKFEANPGKVTKTICQKQNKTGLGSNHKALGLILSTEKNKKQKNSQLSTWAQLSSSDCHQPYLFMVPHLVIHSLLSFFKKAKTSCSFSEKRFLS
jgi:hypothetical protein